MKPLQFQRKKSNILFLFKLIKYYFQTGPKPKFNKHILKDQSFFSLLKHTFTIEIAHQTLKEYNDYKNTWLYSELEKYVANNKKHEESNLKAINIIRKISNNAKIYPVILKEYNYKLANKHLPRSSLDIDILIKTSNIFKYDKILKKNGFLVKDIEIKLGFKPHLLKDGYLKITKVKNQIFPQARKKMILEQIRKQKDIVYLHREKSNRYQILELHFTPNPGCPFKYISLSRLRLDLINKHSYKKNGLKIIKPELRILYDANHFYTHLKHRKNFNNGKTNFMAHLKRLLDIMFNLSLEKKINWDELLFYTKYYNKLYILYIYLKLSKKCLNANIPNKIIKKIEHHINYIPKKIINNINIFKLFQDKKEIMTKLLIIYLKIKSYE